MAGGKSANRILREPQPNQPLDTFRRCPMLPVIPARELGGFGVVQNRRGISVQPQRPARPSHDVAEVTVHGGKVADLNLGIRRLPRTHALDEILRVTVTPGLFFELHQLPSVVEYLKPGAFRTPSSNLNHAVCTIDCDAVVDTLQLVGRP